MCGAGRSSLALGERERAVQQFQEAAFLAGRSALPLAMALSGLEAACGDPEAFRSFCRLLQEQHPDAGADFNPASIGFVQWFLEPTAAATASTRLLRVEADDFTTSLAPDWDWHDPLGDSSFHVANSLVIEAANGRNLWHVNLSAPRLLRPAAGEFAVQTVCVPLAAADGKPARSAKASIGGLLIWRDAENFFCLARGTRGLDEVAFWGCADNRGRIIGRGRLQSDRVFLRLERSRQSLKALCSADGRQWYSVGEAETAIEDPVEVGLHAIGAIDRTVYHGSYREGTAIRFESFRLWR
jgi:hypothetical protein